MLKTWWAYVFLIIIFIFGLILSWCRVTLVGAIRRHITILNFKRLAAYIMFLHTKALYSAKIFIDAQLVQVLFD